MRTAPVYYEITYPGDMDLEPLGYIPTSKEIEAQERKRKTIDNWRKICDNLKGTKET